MGTIKCKMTDEEIEKALELCKSENLPCQECAYWHISTQGCNCRNTLIRDIADYINRLKAEKEQIRKETAKEILHDIYRAVKKFLDEDTLEYIFDSVYRKYGVEVDDE